MLARLHLATAYIAVVAFIILALMHYTQADDKFSYCPRTLLRNSRSSFIQTKVYLDVSIFSLHACSVALSYANSTHR